jgi:hypothetical protein
MTKLFEPMLYEGPAVGMYESLTGQYVSSRDYYQVKSERDGLVALLREIIDEERGHEEYESNDGVYTCCEACAACKAKKYLSEHNL